MKDFISRIPWLGGGNIEDPKDLNEPDYSNPKKTIMQALKAASNDTDVVEEFMGGHEKDYLYDIMGHVIGGLAQYLKKKYTHNHSPYAGALKTGRVDKEHIKRMFYADVDDYTQQMGDQRLRKAYTNIKVHGRRKTMPQMSTIATAIKEGGKPLIEHFFSSKRRGIARTMPKIARQDALAGGANSNILSFAKSIAQVSTIPPQHIGTALLVFFRKNGSKYHGFQNFLNGFMKEVADLDKMTNFIRQEDAYHGVLDKNNGYNDETKEYIKHIHAAFEEALQKGYINKSLQAQIFNMGSPSEKVKGCPFLKYQKEYREIMHMYYNIFKK